MHSRSWYWRELLPGEGLFWTLLGEQELGAAPAETVPEVPEAKGSL